jgi:hypothetical protein
MAPLHETSVDARDVGQGVDAPVGGGDDAVDVRLRRDVAGDRDEGDVEVRQVGDERLQLVGEEVDGDDAAALTGHAGGGRPADPGGRAGHDDGLAREPARRGLLAPGAGAVVVAVDRLLGEHAAVGPEHEVVDDRLRQLALAQRDELLQRQAAHGSERRLVERASLPEDLTDEGAALGVVEPVADGGGAGQRAVVRGHGVSLPRV